MAEIPTKLYTMMQNGVPSLSALPSYNITDPRQSEVTDYNQLYDFAKQRLDQYKQNISYLKSYGMGDADISDIQSYNQLGGDSLYQKLINKTATSEEIAKVFGGSSDLLTSFNALKTGATVNSGYITTADGNMTTQATLNEQAANEAAVAAGTMKNIGTATAPLYVPTGSAAELQAQGKTMGEQLATPSVQEQIKTQGLTPVVPIAPQINPQTNASLGGGGITGTSYKIQSGDTLSAIALRNGTTVQALMDANPGITDPNKIYAGQNLVIPGSTAGGGGVDGGAGGAGGDGSATGDTTGGGGGVTEQTVQSPSDFSTLYTQALKDSGVSDIKTQFEAVVKEQTDLTNEMNDKIADVNENPWMSQSVRNREIGRIQSRYEGRLTTLTNEQKLFDSLYQQGIAEAKFLATGEAEQQQFILKYIQDAEDAKAKLQQQAIDNKDKSLKAVNGGLYDTSTNSWIVSPKATTTGLTPAQINSTINSIANSFDNEPIVKEFNTINSYVNTFKNLGTSATDDQARIYAFAKVMDPNSVVRESEYKTVQDYSQALLKAYGVNIARIFTDIGALTPEARASMQKTLDTKLNSQKAVYNNLYNEYQKRLSNVQSGGFNTLTDYGQPLDGSTDESVNSDIQALRDAGYTDEQIQELINQ